MLGNLLGKGVVDSASEFGQSREKTKQWKEWSKVQLEHAAGSWRPALSRALGGAVVLHVVMAAVLLLTWLFGTVTQASWADDIEPLWNAWLDYAGELFLLATTFLTGYGVARSVFDKSGSKETIRERVTGMFRSPKKAGDEAVERLEMQAPSSINRLPETEQVAPLSGEINLRQLEKEIKREEGFRDHIYLDSLGHPTFGYGHLVTRNDPEYGEPVNTKVGQRRIDSAFLADLSSAINDAEASVESFDNLPQIAKHVLVSMSFQLGGPRLRKFKNMIAALEIRDFGTAAVQAMDSKAAQQTPKRWLRHAEALQSLV